MKADIYEQSRIIEETNPTLRLQRQFSLWRRIQDSGICRNEYTISLDAYITQHLKQSSDLLVRWSNQPPKDLFDPFLVLQAHQASFENLHPWAGKIRETEVVFGRFTATSHIHIAMGLQVLARLIRQMPEENAFQRLYKIATYHIALIGLHPFLDGNGRASRSIMAVQLARGGLNPLPAFQYIEANKHEYLRANNQGLEANHSIPLADLLAKVYNIQKDEVFPHDFRLRYYPAHCERIPISEDTIRHECEHQSAPAAGRHNSGIGNPNPAVQYGN